MTFNAQEVFVICLAVAYFIPAAFYMGQFAEGMRNSGLAEVHIIRIWARERPFHFAGFLGAMVLFWPVMLVLFAQMAKEKRLPEIPPMPPGWSPDCEPDYEEITVETCSLCGAPITEDSEPWPDEETRA